jgi:hypothetical protein
VNKNTGRTRMVKFSVILGAGLFALLVAQTDGVIAARSTSSQAPDNSAINRSIPGAKTGLLKTIKDNTAQIDNSSYRLAPRVIVETHRGRSISHVEGWEKRLTYPVPVQYWVGPAGLHQMILLGRGKDSSELQK